MKDLTAIRGKYYLRQIIAEGEHEQQDFKYSVSDALKIARSISAFANNRGGRLLIGVKDNGVIAGVRNEEDIYVVEQAARMYCRPAVELRFTAIMAGEGLRVIRAEIPACGSKGVKCREADGRWRAYYRVKDENILASPVMVKAWQRAASAKPVTIASGSAEEEVLRLIDRSGTATLRSITGTTHLSAGAATRAVCALYAAGLADFEFRGRSFVVVRRE